MIGNGGLLLEVRATEDFSWGLRWLLNFQNWQIDAQTDLLAKWTNGRYNLIALHRSRFCLILIWGWCVAERWGIIVVWLIVHEDVHKVLPVACHWIFIAFKAARSLQFTLNFVHVSGIRLSHTLATGWLREFHITYNIFDRILVE